MNQGEYQGLLQAYGHADWIQAMPWCETARLLQTQPVEAQAFLFTGTNNTRKDYVRRAPSDHRKLTANRITDYLADADVKGRTFEDIIRDLKISKGQSNKDILQELVDNRKVIQSCPGRRFRYSLPKSSTIPRGEETDDE